jgi:curved DNA-binding protein CbpA/DNA-binding response OmpR family regulator
VPGPVLIVEDEESASRLLATLCAELGVAAQVTRSGAKAKEMLADAQQANRPFVAVVLDLVLAELDGFQVGQFVRAQPWGAELPLVVVSGVYKQPNPDLIARLQPQAYFAKPFDLPELRDALIKACKVEGATTSASGELSKSPAPRLFVELLQKKSTGVLTLTHESTVRRIWFQHGMIRYAQSTVLAETAGAAQVASGLVKQASFDRALALARQNKVAVHEALGQSRVMTPEQIRAAVKQQTIDTAMNALAMEAGQHRFDPHAPEQLSQVPDARISPVAVVLEAAKRLGSPEAARAWLEERAAQKMARSPELERELFSVKNTWPGESVTPIAAGTHTVAEALARIKGPEQPLLHWLCLSGLVHLSGGQKAPSPPPEPAEDESRFSQRGRDARKTLAAAQERLREANHYEVLGVLHSAPVEAVKKAYVAAAKLYHSDAFSGLDLGSARRIAEELFGKVSEAHQVLSDAEKRAEYDVYLDRKAKGLPTDVGAVVRAEGLFQRGEKLFAAGKWREAESAFRQAIALNHAEPEFHAYLGMAMFRAGGNADEAVGLVERALQMDPRLRSAALFLSRMHEARGDEERAKSVLREVLKTDPEFGEAKTELARLRKSQPPPKKGLLERLLKK